MERQQKNVFEKKNAAATNHITMKELSQRNHQIRARVINEHWNSDQVSFSPRFSCTLFMHCAYQQKTTSLRYKTSSSNMSYGLEKKNRVCVWARGREEKPIQAWWATDVRACRYQKEISAKMQYSQSAPSWCPFHWSRDHVVSKPITNYLPLSTIYKACYTSTWH